MWLSVSVCLSVCAMLSKEQGITSLALCLIYDLFIFSQVYSNTTLYMTSLNHSQFF